MVTPLSEQRFFGYLILADSLDQNAVGSVTFAPGARTIYLIGMEQVPTANLFRQ